MMNQGRAAKLFTLYGAGAIPVKTGNWGHVWAAARRASVETPGRSLFIRQGVTADGSVWVQDGIALGRMVYSFEQGQWRAL